MTPVVSLEHVVFAYPNSLPVLPDVSLAVYPGQFVGLIGPNGGGKTTLLKLILGFLKPSKGTIRVFGEPPGSRSNTRRVAYVPQAVRFDRQFPISVLEVVLSGLLFNLPWYGSFYSKDRQAAYEALDKVGLREFADVSFGTLSGGQAQRVLIARALVSQPQLLLLDEPTASVDSQAEADIYAILHSLKGQMTIMMVTHNLQAVIDHVQHVFCIQQGVIPLKPEEVCEHFVVGLYHPPLIHNLPNRSR